MIRLSALAALLALSAGATAKERYAFVQAERLEYRDRPETLLWDLQGWYGGDYHKFWWKTEGELDGSTVEDAELQLLYSRAWTAFFDLQGGIRVQDLDSGSLTSAVLGLQGMAPYRFETDVALFVSEHGDVGARAEFEREFLLTQRLVLQPRAELALAFADVPELRTASGFSRLSLGARLRYEFSRKFAPYLGLSWNTALGDTADLVEAAGEDRRETTLVAGLRFWF